MEAHSVFPVFLARYVVGIKMVLLHGLAVRSDPQMEMLTLGILLQSQSIMRYEQPVPWLMQPIYFDGCVRLMHQCSFYV
jgi:hypothetical protein